MTLNIFRLVGDLSHLFSILILLIKIDKTRSAAGISFKSQALYALVFVTRYLDLLHFISIYNTLMKLFFISSSFYIIYLMLFQFRATWDPTTDSMQYEYLVIGSFFLSLFINQKFDFIHVLWAFSIYLESVAILPQLFQLQQTGEAENITVHYLFCLGSYRALYILNWIYRYVFENHVDWIAIVSGVVQTAVYSDFLYIYVTRVLRGKRFKLPA